MTDDPDAALREAVIALINEAVADGLAFPDKRERLATDILAATASPGLDEEHCCGDPSHMSPEYLAAINAALAADRETPSSDRTDV